MAKKKQRTIVGSPLTPTLLDELGALSNFPPSSEDFKPNGNWVNTYRIWTCHGYRESGNENVGFVQIERATGKPNKSFTLKVHQQVVETDGMLNIIDASIKCLNNELASPVQWHLTSRIIRPDRKQRRELGTEEKVLINGNVMSIETSGHTIKRKVSSQLTCDWCLFEAIQRLAFNKQTSLNFDLLEGLSLLKKGQRLSYRGLYPTKMSGENIPLHCFVQLGNGILPCKYWLDDHHRLLVVVSMNKAYIFDEQAEKITRQIIKEEQKSYEKRKSSQRK